MSWNVKLVGKPEAIKEAVDKVVLEQKYLPLGIASTIKSVMNEAAALAPDETFLVETNGHIDGNTHGSVENPTSAVVYGGNADLKISRVKIVG